MLNYQRVSSHILGQIRQKHVPLQRRTSPAREGSLPCWSAASGTVSRLPGPKNGDDHHGDSCWSLGSDWHEKVTALLVGGWKTHLKNDGVRQLGWLSLAGHLKIYRLLAGEKPWLKRLFFLWWIYQTIYLVGVWKPPLKNDGVRQLGWWHSQLNGKIKKNPNHQPD